MLNVLREISFNLLSLLRLLQINKVIKGNKDRMESMKKVYNFKIQSVIISQGIIIHLHIETKRKKCDALSLQTGSYYHVGTKPEQ